MSNPTTLPLADARGEFCSSENDGQWEITDKDGKHLTFFPACLKDKQVMTMIRFARKYEKEGYVKGMEAGRQVAMAAGKQKFLEMEALMAGLKQENERLADLVEAKVLSTS